MSATGDDQPHSQPPGNDRFVKKRTFVFALESAIPGPFQTFARTSTIAMVRDSPGGSPPFRSKSSADKKTN